MQILGFEIRDEDVFCFANSVEITFIHVYAIDQFFLPDN